MSRAPRTSPQTIAVLDELIQSPMRWRYGYDLMRATGISAGTLYPILARLAKHGWLDTEWGEVGEDGRPPRHHYRLTPMGRAEGRAMIARAADFALLVRDR